MISEPENTRLSSPVSGTDDYVMVPREPTEAMVAAWENACPKAGWQALQDMSDADANAALVHAEWSAMLSAAPEAAIQSLGERSREAFRPIETWDQRDEPVLLLVDYDDGDHPLEDARFAITIGHNNDHNVGEGEGQGWLFAGWCWSHDHYTQGKGEVVGWMPLPHILARAWAAFDGEPAASPTPPIPMIAEAGVEVTQRQQDPVCADYAENFLIAHVSKDGSMVGINHPCDADWADVMTAHVALRDRINDRIAEQDGCPFKPRSGPMIAEAGERSHQPIKWRERWYGSEPQRGSAIVDERGNLIAYFGGDEATHKATTAAVTAHNAALSTPATLDNTAVEVETGPPCVGCGKPVAVGQVVLCYDDAGEVHADCERPYRLVHRRKADDPVAMVLLGSPMVHVPLATLTAKTEKAE